MLSTNSVFLAVVAAGIASVNAVPRPAAQPVARDATTNPVIIQMFEWNWNSVAQECTDFIGPAGYAYVQVSPATEHITGDSWWTDYQKVSNQLISKRGSRDEFSSMVTTCKNAGVGVLVDAIWNHMAGSDSGTGVAGTSWTHYNYPGYYSSYDFHYCGTDGNAILDWSNKTQIQFCQLENLADLATETDYVRKTLVDEANDMLSLGVAGFRLDAAKHIPVTDLQYIISQLSTAPYITQEVIGTGQPIPESDYASLGTVSVSDYQVVVENAFKTGGIDTLENVESTSDVTSSAASVWVANMDSERGNNGGGLNYKDGAIYTLAHVFSLTHNYGTPSVLSSYEFSDNDAGAPNSGAGSCSGNNGTNGWLCQHRWTAIANLVKFRTAAGSTSLTNWQTGSNMQIAYERDAVGFVIINNTDGEWDNTFTTGLADGTYCDVISGAVSGSSCTGTTITVSGGKVTASVPSRGAVAFYSGSKL